jgi:hypothetical protein
VRRAEVNGPNPTNRSQKAGQPVATALQNSVGAIAMSEVGLLEFHDVVTAMWRDTNAPNDVYDEAWCDSAIDDAMDDIANGRLLIRPIPIDGFEQAMTLVTMSTRQFGQTFRVWDAVHLITAIGWAAELNQVIELWTTDGDFEGFVGLFPHFASWLTVINLDR